MQFKQLLRQKWELGLKPYTRTFLMWLVCASIAGVACGAVGAVFFHLVSWATGMRQAHPWLLYLLPVGGLVIVFVYQTCRMGTERGTNAVLESAQQGKRAPLRLGRACCRPPLGKQPRRPRRHPGKRRRSFRCPAPRRTPAAWEQRRRS